MKFYSETLNKMFESAEECAKAEKEDADKKAEIAAKQKALANERAARAKEIEDANKKVVEARKEYEKLLSDFIHDFGSYHTTFKSIDPLWTLFNWLN